MKHRKKREYNPYQRRERREMKNAARKIIRKIASEQDYSNLKTDSYKVYSKAW